MLTCLLGLGWAGAAAAGSLEAESVALFRHDHFGEAYLPAWQLLSFDQELGSLAVEGYGGLEWLAGVAQPLDPDLYHLNLAGPLAQGRWVLGRQQGMGALRRQTFDGVSLRCPLGDRLTVAAWGGYARHQDLDDMLDRVVVSRAELSWQGGRLLARAGGQLHVDPQAQPVLRQDLEARLRLGDGPRAAGLTGHAVLAELTEQETALLEWARVGVSFRPVSSLEASVHGRHREAADPDSLFGDAILDTLAGGAVSEAGLGLRWLGARWAAISARGAVVSYGEDECSVLGYRFDLAWRPGLSSSAWRLSPALASRTGPGGQYHALYARASWQATDATELSARAAVVPYLKGEQPWDTVLTGGLELQQEFTAWLRLGAMVDAATDDERPLDLRGGAVLSLGWL